MDGSEHLVNLEITSLIFSLDMKLIENIFKRMFMHAECTSLGGGWDSAQTHFISYLILVVDFFKKMDSVCLQVLTIV